MTTEGTTEEFLQEDEAMCKTLASFRFVKWNFTKHARPEDFLYESLCKGLGI